MVGQISLNNFYQSVKFGHPFTAIWMEDDIAIVAMYGLGADKTGGQEAADRLRQKSLDLPEVLKQVLESALTELGYS